jgi:large subunit ribosomal protein L23
MALWNKVLGTGETPRNRAAAPHPETKREKDASASADADTHAASAKAAAGILLSPHMTEKSTGMSEKGVYVFRVASGTNKHRVASAVALRYGVGVERVRTIVQPAKERRRGRQIGWKPGFKKAIVQLKQGQVIESL